METKKKKIEFKFKMPKITLFLSLLSGFVFIGIIAFLVKVLFLESKTTPKNTSILNRPKPILKASPFKEEKKRKETEFKLRKEKPVKEEKEEVENLDKVAEELRKLFIKSKILEKKIKLKEQEKKYLEIVKEINRLKNKNETNYKLKSIKTELVNSERIRRLESEIRYLKSILIKLKIENKKGKKVKKKPLIIVDNYKVLAIADKTALLEGEDGTIIKVKDGDILKGAKVKIGNNYVQVGNRRFELLIFQSERKKTQGFIPSIFRR